MRALSIVVPLALGALAGGLNYYVVQGMIAPIELTAVRDDLRADAEIKSAEMLVKVQVRSDRADILKSAVPWSDRGTVVGRRVGRALSAGEVVLFADVRADGAADIRAMLKANETSFTFQVRAGRIAPGLRVGETVAVIVPDPDAQAPDRPGRQVIGPLRLLAVGERADPFRAAGGDDFVKVSVAAARTADGKLPAALVAADAAASPEDGAGRRSRVLAVEFFKP